jgi:hypothetical protein
LSLLALIEAERENEKAVKKTLCLGRELQLRAGASAKGGRLSQGQAAQSGPGGLIRARRRIRGEEEEENRLGEGENYRF